MQFDDQVLRFLKSSQQVLDQSEFEIFGLAAESSTTVEREAQSRGATSSQFPTPELYHRHGGSGQQACQRWSSVQCAASLGANPQEVALHLPDDTAVGDSHPPCGGPSRGRDGGHVRNERFQLEPHSGSAVNGGLSTTTRGLSNIEGIDDQDISVERGGRDPGDPLAPRHSAKVSLHVEHEDMGLSHGGQQRADLCTLSTTSGSSVPLFPMVRESALGRPDYREDEEGNPQSTKEILTAMIQDKYQHKNTTKSGTNGVQEKKTCRNCMKVWITKKQPTAKEASSSTSTKGSSNSWSGNALTARSRTEVPEKGPPCFEEDS